MAKYESRNTRLMKAMEAVSMAKEEVEMLRDEIASWQENMEGTNLESTTKYEALGECADELDEIVEQLEEAVNISEGIMFPSMFG